MLYICTKFDEYILKGVRIIEQTISILKFTKGHNSIHVGGVMVLVLCTLSDDAFYLYQVS